MKRPSAFTLGLFFLFSNVNPTLGNSLFMGLVGRDFVLLAADALVTQSWQIQTTAQDPIRLHRNMACVSSNQRLLDLVQAHAIWMEYSQLDSFGTDVTVIQASTGVIQQPQTHSFLQLSSMAQFLRQHLMQQQDAESGCLMAGMVELKSGDDITDDYSFSGHVVQTQLSQVLTSGNRLLPPLPDTSIDMNREPIVAENANESRYRPFLYWLDAHGSLLNVKYAAIGYASPWMWSWLDQRYRPDMTLAEAIALVVEGWQTLQASRSFLRSKLCLKYIDAQGNWHTVEESSSAMNNLPAAN